MSLPRDHARSPLSSRSSTNGATAQPTSTWPDMTCGGRASPVATGFRLEAVFDHEVRSTIWKQAPWWNRRWWPSTSRIERSSDLAATHQKVSREPVELAPMMRMGAPCRRRRGFRAPRAQPDVDRSGDDDLQRLAALRVQMSRSRPCLRKMPACLPSSRIAPSCRGWGGDLGVSAARSSGIASATSAAAVATARLRASRSSHRRRATRSRPSASASGPPAHAEHHIPREQVQILLRQVGRQRRDLQHSDEIADPEVARIGGELPRARSRRCRRPPCRAR